MRKSHLFFVLVCGVFLFGGVGKASAATYYVDATSGSDTNNGTSQSTPWKTIAKVNVSTFQPGDSILFKKGETWREQLTVPSSGSVGNPITLSAYGNGDLPIIDASIAVSSWTGPDGNGVYSKTGFTKTIYTVFEDHLPKKMATNATLSDGVWYYNSGTLYYKPTTGLPSDHSVSYITSYVDKLTNGIDISNKSDITIENIYFRNNSEAVNSAETAGTGSPNQRITVKNCEFVYNFNGILLQPRTKTSSGGIITGNHFYRNNRSIALYDIYLVHTVLFDNWTISNNDIEETGVYDGSNIWNQVWSGAGDQEAVGTQNLNNSTISDNYIHGGYNLGIVLYSWPEAKVENNLILRNKFQNTRRAAYYLCGGGPANNNTFAYNLMWNCATDSTSPFVIHIYQGATASSMNYVYNNVVYGGGHGIYLPANIPNYWFTFNNNIIGNTTISNVYVEYAPAELVFDYNFYPMIGVDKFVWNGHNSSYRTFSYWQGTLGNDTHGQMVDPLFQNTLTGDFTLSPTSPAINAGVDVGLSTDFPGNPIVGAPDIGAFEYQGAIIDTTPPAAPTGVSVN